MTVHPVKFIPPFALILIAAAISLGQTVTGQINGPVKKGRSAKATVILDIPSELHTNSHLPLDRNLIATDVKIVGKGLSISPVRYPPGRNRRFEFSPRPLNVYQGKVVFSFQITVPRSYRGKEISVDAAVKYQACTDEVCYPPRTKTVTLTAHVQ